MRLGNAAGLPRFAEQIRSPDDPEARYSNKRDVIWVGYKVLVTETCDHREAILRRDVSEADKACEGPHVINNVETTPATVPDDNMVAVVHACLEKRGLLPGEHLERFAFRSGDLFPYAWFWDGFDGWCVFGGLAGTGSGGD